MTGLSLVHEVRAKLLMKSLRFHNWKRALGMTGTSTEIRDLYERLRGKCLPQAPSLRHMELEGPVQFQGLRRAAAGTETMAPGWYTVENSCGATEFGGTPCLPLGAHHMGPRPAGL